VLVSQGVMTRQGELALGPVIAVRAPSRPDTNVGSKPVRPDTSVESRPDTSVGSQSVKEDPSKGEIIPLVAKLSPVETIKRDNELKHWRKEMENLRGKYDSHETWANADRIKLK